VDTIKHYGTRTQGEDYRIERVADKILSMMNDMCALEEQLRDLKIDNRIKVSIT
jgi:hypothetical protein